MAKAGGAGERGAGRSAGGGRDPGPGGPSPGGGAPWHLRNVLSDSVESSDDEFFDAREEVAEGKSAILIGMSQWSSNDLVEQIETMGKLEEHQALSVGICGAGFISAIIFPLSYAPIRFWFLPNPALRH
ncbi:hypothetical protein ACRRTK_007079 [Alexandromys fortis]